MTMKRYLIYMMAVAAAMTLWGCEASFDGNIGDNNDSPGKPTVPIKKRPIVPSTKLPRPRLIEKVVWTGTAALAVEFAESVPTAEVIVRNTITDEELGYIFEGKSIEVAIPDEACELTINVANESYTYSIE